MFRYAAVLFVLLSLSGFTWAAGPYVEWQGGVGGLYTKEYSNDSDPYYKVYLRDGMAYRLSAGYLWDRPKFRYGLEMGYAGYPQNKYEFSFPGLSASGVQKYQGDYVDVLGVLQYSLMPWLKKEIYLIGKAGVARVKQQFDGSSSAFGTTFALTKTVRQYQWEAALGVGYHVTQAIGIDLNYHHVFAGQADPFANATTEQNTLTRISAINTLMAGVSYSFS